MIITPAEGALDTEWDQREDEGKDKLAMLARRPKSAQAMAMRARVVLGGNAGWSCWWLFDLDI